MNRNFFSSLLVFCAVIFQARASHIIGGEMIYRCLGSNNYEITLKVYRDCYNGIPPLDDPAYVAVYNASGICVDTLELIAPDITNLPVVLNNPCLVAPPNVCVEEGIYVIVVNLPPSPGGYDLVYQRCCRNNSIININNPGNTGATYAAHIPDASFASCNNSPVFVNFPPIAVCNSEPLIFDHHAFDPDGDSLVYSLCTPFIGGDQTNSQPIPATPPPFSTVNFIAPYNVNNQLGGTPAMTIDPQTGFLTAHPIVLGQFVVGVMVKEYRNGILLGEHRRDFQFNVADCTPLVLAVIANVPPQDTLVVCDGFTVNFGINSIGGWFYHWDFGVNGITNDTSAQVAPSFTYPDTGTYKVSLVANPGIACVDTTYSFIRINPPFTAGFIATNNCFYNPIQFTDQTVANMGSINQWNWNFGDGTTSSIQNPSHTYGAPGTYNVTLTATRDDGCPGIFSMSVEAYPRPTTTAGPDTMICNVDAVTLIATGGVSYSWTPDYNLSGTNSASELASPDTTTNYFVTVTDANGCTNLDSVLIRVVDHVEGTISPDTTICEGQTVLLVAGNAVYYHWWADPALTSLNNDSTFATPNITTTFIVDSYIGSCVDEDTVTVTVLPAPNVDAGENITINQGEQVHLIGTGAQWYIWSPAYAITNLYSASTIVSPLNTTTYYLLGTGANGCPALDSVTIIVTHIHEINLPNAFTPNNDGTNDFFEYFTTGIRALDWLRIYNRWGQTVFESHRLGDFWDGKFHDEQQPADVYIVLVRAITFDGDLILKKGNITLLR